MSIQINIGDHTSSEPNFIAVPANRLKQLQWARTKAKWITRNIPRADVYYRTLPGGRSLTELLADRDIWINFHPTSTDMGLTNFAGGKEIAICVPSFRIGRWTVRHPGARARTCEWGTRRDGPARCGTRGTGMRSWATIRADHGR